MKKVWFISDLHFSHVSTLYYHPKRREILGLTIDDLQNDKNECIRKHDDWLINLWNTTINKHDVVYILGDFCLGNKETTEKILQKLHGVKHLIRGNHDRSCKTLYNYFEWVGDIKEVKFQHQEFPFIDEKEIFSIQLCHFPLYTWKERPKGMCMCHGHTHGEMDDINDNSLELRVDVGLDGNLSNMSFIDLERLYGHFQKLKEKLNVRTFKEYNEKLMLKQGRRL